jgi:flagellar motor switch protein FliG
MSKHKNNIFFAVFCFICIFVPLAAAAVSSPVAEKVAAEEHLDARLTRALESLLGEGNFVVITNVEMNPQGKEISTEKWEITPTETQSEGQKGDEMLPGVPSSFFAGRNPGPSQGSKIIESSAVVPEIMIKKLSATILVDKKVKADQIANADKLARIVLGINPARGDTIQIQQVDLNMVKLAAGKKSDEGPLGVIIRYLAVFAAIALLLFYFLNRIGKITLQATSTINEGRKKEFTSSMRMTRGAETAGASAETVSRGAQAGEDSIKKPFSFISSKDIPKLAKILAQEDSVSAADALSLMEPKMSSSVISMVSDKLKDDVFARIADNRQLDKAAIEALESRIRSKMEGTIGGDEDISELIENSDQATAARILSLMNGKDPKRAEQIRSGMVLFDDVLKLPPKELTKILSRASLEDVSVIIQSSDKKIGDMFMSGLPEDSLAIVKEWLDLMPKQSKETVEAAKKNLCLTAKQLEKSGELKINRGAR